MTGLAQGLNGWKKIKGPGSFFTYGFPGSSNRLVCKPPNHYSPQFRAMIEALEKGVGATRMTAGLCRP
jgi:hypothetical protein